jgi:hypothetical protein
MNNRFNWAVVISVLVVAGWVMSYLKSIELKEEVMYVLM